MTTSDSIDWRVIRISDEPIASIDDADREEEMRIGIDLAPRKNEVGGYQEHDDGHSSGARRHEPPASQR